MILDAKNAEVYYSFRSYIRTIALSRSFTPKKHFRHYDIMIKIFHREFIYLLYYFELQFLQIFWYWLLGIAIGSFISVFVKDGIHRLFDGMRDRKWGIFGIVPACLLGIASPLCMYGTIPVAASFARHGMRQDWLAAFMMASVLLNPQLIAYSAALGPTVLCIRILSCFLCGVAAGLQICFLCKGSPFFNFSGFTDQNSRDTHPNLLIRYFLNVCRYIRATGPYFLLGIFLSAVFQRYVPQDLMIRLFGGNRAWGVLMAATIGVPLYACGGGTIPLLRQWLWDGMSYGSAAAFMITGPATKITNLGALKIILGFRCFIFYLLFSLLSALLTGLFVNFII